MTYQERIPAIRSWLLREGPWFVAFLIVGVVLSLTRGQSNWWDLLNYHIYNPWSLLHHREGTDLFVAGIQSYFSPYLDVPYYLVSMAWFPSHPRLAAALAGLPFGVLIYVTLLLTRTVIADFSFRTPIARHLLAGLLVIAAVTGVSTWSQAISTSNEVTLAILDIAAVTLLIGAFQKTGKGLNLRKSVAIGALLGLAAGLKLTAAIYAPAAGLILLAACANWRQRFRFGSAFFLAWLCLFLITWGPWAWHLYQVSGDPFFPMFNNVFHSTFAAPIGGRDLRATPQHLLHWIFYPFYWLEPRQQRTVFPFPFRDARYAAAYALGIGALIRGWFIRKDLRRCNKTLIALIAFWFMAYATWLGIFSLLRYAVAIEVTATIVAIGSICFLLQSIRSTGKIAIILPVAAIVTIFLIGFAKIPNLGHIPFGQKTFSADAPHLKQNSLLILGNQPMGILVPLIAYDNPTTTFVGLPSCFAHRGWCKTWFYHYGLGRQIRKKIKMHKGPIYVAYYTNRNPAMPQLVNFGVKFNRHNCTLMQTSVTPDAMLCRATFKMALIGSRQPTRRFRLALETDAARKGVHVKGTWDSNPCASTKTHTYGKLALKWIMPKSLKKVSVYVHSPPGNGEKLLARGGRIGSVTTGEWVQAAQDFIFTDKRGQTLATLSVRYVMCARDQTTRRNHTRLKHR